MAGSRIRFPPIEEHETATPPEGPPAGTPEMRPPRGFEAEKYPLRHRLIYACGLGAKSDTANTLLAPLVMHSSEMDVLANTIQVNPHNSNYESDTGPLVRKMSIIDKMNLSIKFNTTAYWADTHHNSGTSTNEVFLGDGIHSLKLLWRPIFFSFPEKLDAADDGTSTTVAAILGLTKDATFEDVVPLTTNKLPTAGPSDQVQPMSTVNAVQVFGDFNLTTNTGMEDHVFDEDLLQDALRRYTNKGALKACLGRTRHLTLTRTRPYKNYYISKFVPRAIRRVMPYSFFAIQVHVPIESHVSQSYLSQNLASSAPHIGVKIIANYHEWNIEHDQDMGTAA